MTTEPQTTGGWWSQRPTWQKVLMIVGTAFVVLIILGAIFGNGEQADEASGTTTTTVASDETTTTLEDATTTTEPEATTTTTSATTTTTLPPVLEEGSGRGDDVVEFSIPDVPAVVTFTHNGGSNFAVWSLDTDFETVDLLVNTIGDYQGTRPIQFDLDRPITGFEITADGDWTFVVAPLTQIEEVDCPFTGRGDDVIAVTNFIADGGPASLAFDAPTNFAIWAYGVTGTDLIVNEIGPYEGTVRVPSGMYIWDITGNDGSWSIDCG